MKTRRYMSSGKGYLEAESSSTRNSDIMIHSSQGTMPLFMYDTMLAILTFFPQTLIFLYPYLPVTYPAR